MFQKVDQAQFLEGEHQMFRFWRDQNVFQQLLEKNKGKKKWSFLDGPITANNPMGVHHAWGRTFKDAYQRYFAMTGHELRYQNGFDCQGLWVEVEVQKELKLDTKESIENVGIDVFTRTCKKRVLKFAARQTEQSQRLGYWMEWDDPAELRKLSENIDSEDEVSLRTPKGKTVTGPAEQLVSKLGNPEWGGSYFTFSTENNETIWTFLKKCFERGKIYLGHDVMPWGGQAGSAYSQMEIADGRKLTTHKSVFVRFPLVENPGDTETRRSEQENLPEYLLIWTTTPWTLTSNVATMINPDLEYVRVKAQIRGDEEPAIYYFAKENLNFKRLEKEFKEGFGRPEWQWPEGLGKLKTIAQIFKEQGGFEEVGSVKGADLVGWKYQGPFDELEAQQQPGGYPSKLASGESPEANSDLKSSVDSHRVVDAGRDFKGNAIVVAGEGTGIVHSAPGCGDVDHKIGMELGLPAIAPLKEDGSFGEGFGPFTGKKAVDPETVSMVLDSLKEKNLLVYVEEYPHIYPHCWRTGEELVFRLVDEWFINMDWRDEIKAVTECINWIPDSIQGKEREIEWLNTMRDWMISKKRYWGLALPIWVNPDDPTDFDVIGSLQELEERAKDGGEGWDEFEGHTPHRPWIDVVKIRSKKTGALMHRIEDVGNPWLDAGIVPFSTMNYNGRNTESDLNWDEWFPADLVTECFPGQFRNWFYSLLSLATMMRHDETDDPEEKKPFKNLLGHRLVMDETGQPMHKSDGTAIWFEEAAEQIGVDTIRWMYLAQNPASDLRFGTRHPDEPVTLETPEGPINETQEGLPTCKVTSTPADNIRRQVLIPLWNSYAFFVNYAVLDGFDPKAEQVPLQDRAEIDRWILSRLQELTQVAHDSFQSFNAANFMQAATEYIDDLSNWYIRRNRRRFWKAVGEDQSSEDSSHSSNEKWDADKLAAYQTLYEVLVTLSKLLAPAIPFLSERMYQNLVVEGLGSRDKSKEDSLDSGDSSLDHPLSVHLTDYPTVDESKVDPELDSRGQAIKTLVRMGHRLRESAELRVRQPLAELRFACDNPATADALNHSHAVIADELNVKSVSLAENLDDLVSYSFKPNLKTLGPKYGKLLGAIRKELPEIDEAILAPLRNDEAVTLTLGGEEISLEPADVLISVEQASDWASADADGIQIALSTNLTDELIAEGMARDLIRQVQQLRKEANLEENQRIQVLWSTSDNAALINSAINTWSETIQTETRADSITESKNDGKQVNLGDASISLKISY
ncbi:class I tRNA ligase family protein [Thalassoglobus polymorphus]|uniref:Isoleucine--tRNA ligase n=1 Tax=Thalassoglobus polymorphus TaxID=2527994 RepID=A0A517QSS9_9PLAN|nr:class I tRNA ligase family protein [Thalassoglobus polymorphus]QDT34688.1 Isoleucine--tRNA ligase [Thalassoglobus polymorphus]